MQTSKSKAKSKLNIPKIDRTTLKTAQLKMHLGSNVRFYSPEHDNFKNWIDTLTVVSNGMHDRNGSQLIYREIFKYDFPFLSKITISITKSVWSNSYG